MDEKPNAELLRFLDLLLDLEIAESADDWDVLEALGRGGKPPTPPLVPEGKDGDA